VRCPSRFPCLSAIAGKIIYYFIFGVLGACRQAPYKFKKSYGGGSVLELPIVSILGTGKHIIFNRQGVQVPLNASYRTTRVWGGTKDHHSALLCGHSTLNTVVLGEGVSNKVQIHPLLWPP
jgi:hypothetical protein